MPLMLLECERMMDGPNSVELRRGRRDHDFLPYDSQRPHAFLAVRLFDQSRSLKMAQRSRTSEGGNRAGQSAHYPKTWPERHHNELQELPIMSDPVRGIGICSCPMVE